VGINGRDDVQRCEREARVIERQLIERAIGSKANTTACARSSIAYERRSRRGEVDGVQPASETERVRADSIEHSSARLEAQIADAKRCPVIVDDADGSDQGAVVRVDLDEGAGAAGRYGRAKEAAVWMEGNPAQARARNRRAHDGAGAICLIDGDQRARIHAIAIAAVHR
jgi:hypothetical protein